ncbi:MAG: hypothetical protein WBN89_15815 [Prochlorococcaceae cyanobacterium]
MAVSALVWEDGGDEDQLIAALLHDTTEDAGASDEGHCGLLTSGSAAGMLRACPHPLSWHRSSRAGG